MRRLHLVRHARTRVTPGSSAHTWPLTEEGRAQAAELARHLQGSSLPLARVVSSAEPKARDTAQAIAAALGVPCETRSGLQEQSRAAAPFYDRPEDFHAALRAFFARPAERAFGEESADEAHARFYAALADVMGEETGDGLVVTHGTVLSLLVARANKRDPFEFWRRELAMPMLVTLSWPDLRELARFVPEGATRSPG